MQKRSIWISVVLMAVVLLQACGAEPAPAEPPAAASLEVTGMVDQALSLTTDDLREVGWVQGTAEHPKDGPQDYEGVPLNDLLDKAGVQSGASVVMISASDGYSADIPLEDIRGCADCAVSIEDDGTLDMVMSGMSGKAWVKDVVSMEVK